MNIYIKYQFLRCQMYLPLRSLGALGFPGGFLLLILYQHLPGRLFLFFSFWAKNHRPGELLLFCFYISGDSLLIDYCRWWFLWIGWMALRQWLNIWRMSAPGQSSTFADALHRKSPRWSRHSATWSPRWPGPLYSAS
jgi:hypothetical protein